MSIRNLSAQLSQTSLDPPQTKIHYFVPYLVCWWWNLYMDVSRIDTFDTHLLFEWCCPRLTHDKIQLLVLCFTKTSKGSLCPFIDVPGAFCCLSTWSWQMHKNSFPWKTKLAERLSGMFCPVFSLDVLYSQPWSMWSILQPRIYLRL